MGLKSQKLSLSKPLFSLLISGLVICGFGKPDAAVAAELRHNFGPSLAATPHEIRPEIRPGTAHYDITRVKTELNPLLHTAELIVELDKIINRLDENAPKMFRVELELFKLDSLAKNADTSVAANQAAKIYAEHPRESFASDVDYGDTMYQIVESLAKTDNLGVAYDIIKKLRFGLYDKPDKYLNFITKKSLIEVHIETSDYQRALNLALSILNDPEFMAIDEIQAWRPRAITEIAYLYNKLGNGEQALVYLHEVAKGLGAEDASLKSVQKSYALNYANRGRAHLLEGDFDQTRLMGQKVLDANKTLKQIYLSAVGHRLIGCAEFKTGNYTRAEEHLKAGVALIKNSDNLSLKRGLYYEYAQVLEKLGQHESAAFWYKELYALELKRQETIAATRAKLNDIEFSALKNHQNMTTLHNELQHSQSINKFMLFAILSLFFAGCILMGLLNRLRRNQRKLKTSEMQAKIANSAKSEFLANMSHEIRTPMNGVLGMAQVLDRTPLSAQQKTYLDIIKQSGNTLLDLINDILDFSKIEADKLILSYESCDLEQIIQETVHLMTPNAQEKNVELRYHYASDFPKHLRLDAKRVRQIMMNLIGNAVKFTDAGSVSVNISGWVQNETAQIKLTVTDTGIGIAPEQVDTIFDKFTQVGKSCERFYGGTGLGLAISKKLSESMNGTLSVTSKLDEGSTFTLTLPAKISRPSTDAKKPSKALNLSRAA